MKKIFAIAAMLLTMFTANAQSNSCQDVKTFSVKPYVGLSSSMLISKNSKTDMRTGFTAGVEGQYQFSKTFALSVGVGYQQQGGKMEETMQYLNGDKIGSATAEGTYKLDYINVPIMANFYVCKGLALKVGVQPGFAVNTKGEAKVSGIEQSGSVDLKDNVRKFDLAIPVGISYEFNNVVLDARVNAGAIGIFKALDASDKHNANNGVFQLTAGYRF